MELSDYISRLDENTRKLNRLVDSLKPGQQGQQEKNGWTVLQVLEHLWLTDQAVHRILSGPSDQHHDADELVGDARLQRFIKERNRKVDAPDELLPEDDISSLAEFRELFRKQRSMLKEDLLSGKIIIDQRIFKHPMLGKMTVSDWLNFLLYHVERHINQINDILKKEESSDAFAGLVWRPLSSDDIFILVPLFIFSCAYVSVGGRAFGNGAFVGTMQFLTLIIPFLASLAVCFTTIGLRFRNLYFSAAWLFISLILMSGAAEFYRYQMVGSFFIYHFIRYVFWMSYKKEFIPSFVIGRGPGDYYSKLEKRHNGSEDKKFMRVLCIFGLAWFMCCLKSALN